MSYRRAIRKLGVALFAVATLAMKAQTESASEGSAIQDLGSLDSGVRWKAAHLIRGQHLYHPTAREKWNDLAKGLKKDMPATEILKRLQKAGIATGFTTADMSTNAVYSFQLDDTWKLVCAINGSVLTEFEVREEPREIFVPPPQGYTGFWQLYQVDGKPTPKLYYDKGQQRILTP